MVSQLFFAFLGLLVCHQAISTKTNPPTLPPIKELAFTGPALQVHTKFRTDPFKTQPATVPLPFVTGGSGHRRTGLPTLPQVSRGHGHRQTGPPTLPPVAGGVFPTGGVLSKFSKRRIRDVQQAYLTVHHKETTFGPNGATARTDPLRTFPIIGQTAPPPSVRPSSKIILAQSTPDLSDKVLTPPPYSTTLVPGRVVKVNLTRVSRLPLGPGISPDRIPTLLTDDGCMITETPFGKHCFGGIPFSLAIFEEATKICNDNGGNLPSVHSATELEAILSSVGPIGLSSGEGEIFDGKEGYWIGGYYIEGDVTWNDETPYDYKLEFQPLGGPWIELPKILNETEKRGVVCAYPKIRLCPEGYKYFHETDKCYRVTKEKKHSQDLAEYACRIDDGHLVSVHSDEEQAFVRSLLEVNKHYWIGYELQGNNPSNYKNGWTDNSAVDYTKPLSVQADPKTRIGGAEKACYANWKREQDDLWHAVPCSNQFTEVSGFVCKKDAFKLRPRRVQSPEPKATTPPKPESTTTKKERFTTPTEGPITTKRRTPLSTTTKRAPQSSTVHQTSTTRRNTWHSPGTTTRRNTSTPRKTSSQGPLFETVPWRVSTSSTQDPLADATLIGFNNKPEKKEPTGPRTTDPFFGGGSTFVPLI